MKVIDKSRITSRKEVKRTIRKLVNRALDRGGQLLVMAVYDGTNANGDEGENTRIVSNVSPFNLICERKDEIAKATAAWVKNHPEDDPRPAIFQVEEDVHG